MSTKIGYKPEVITEQQLAKEATFYKGRDFYKLIPEKQIQKRVRMLADEISRLSVGTQPVIVGVLNGAMYVTVDLSRHLSIRHEVGSMGISSYGIHQTAIHDPRITSDLSCPVEGEDVWLVEDIVEKGRTVRDAIEYIFWKKARSVRVCTLLQKLCKDGTSCLARPDLVGFVVPDLFVVGYGLDLKYLFREMPFIGVPAGKG